MTDAEEAGQRSADSSANPHRGATAGDDSYRSAILPDLTDELVATESTLLDEDYADERQKAMADNFARRQADREFLIQLAMTDFSGMGWEYFSNELAAYSLPVLMSWTRTRKIVNLCADKGRPIPVPPPLWPADERSGIVALTIAKSINVFRDRVLRPARWDVKGGATIKTYFMGSVILQFPNFYNSWYNAREQAHLGSWDELSALGILHDERPGADPTRVVEGRLRLIGVLQDMPADLRKGCLLMLEGHTLTEAARRVGKSPEALGEQLRRFRNRHRGER